MQEIINNLSRYISTQVLKQPKRIIQADEAIISSGLVDSFHLVDLALFVEDTYGVRIDDAELKADTFDSLSQLAALVASRRA